MKLCLDKIADFAQCFPPFEAEVVSIVVYIYIYVYLLTLTWLPKTGGSYLLSRPDSSLRYRRYINHLLTYLRSLFPLSGRKFRNHSIRISNPFQYVMLLLTMDLQQSMTHG